MVLERKLTGSNNVINRFTLSRVPPLCLSTTLATTASTAKPMSNPMSFPKFSQRPTPTMVSAMATISCREFCILVLNIIPNLIFRYLFPILMGLFRPLPSDDIAFSMRMVELLTSFARTGKPSIVMGEDQPPFIWDHVNAANASHLNIGNMMMMDQVLLCQGHLRIIYKLNAGSSKPPADGILEWDACVLERRQKQLCSSATYSQKRGALTDELAS